jgi:hypothetical protein
MSNEPLTIPLSLRLRKHKPGCTCAPCEAADELDRLTAENQRLREQLAAETTRADFAWRNTREIDKARMEQAKRLAQAEALLREARESASRGDILNLVGGMWGHQAQTFLAASGEQK